MSCKEQIWFYIAKIDVPTPARPSPWALQACKSVRQLAPGARFVRGTALGCAEEAELPLQLRSIHPHCPSHSKMKQKPHSSPKHCSACSLWHRGCSPIGEERVSPCSAVTIEE